jgi:phenylacetic acid degradation operon negative regulatory protein
MGKVNGRLPRTAALQQEAAPRLSARSMLVDLFGDFAIEGERRGVMRLASIVALAGVLGVGELAVRAAAARMVQEGWLESKRDGRETIYSLSPRGRQLVAEGRTRIFAAPDEPWNGAWYLVALSVPEARREVRDRMRQELSWLGFGSPSSAVYISPRDHRRAVDRLVEELEANSYVQMYSAVALQPADPRELVARAWPDLQEADDRYAAFLKEFLTRRACNCEGAEAFRLRFSLANRFRKCLFDDPDLPRELLPPGWCGTDARRLFLEFHSAVTPAALEYFDAVCVLKRPAAR